MAASTREIPDKLYFKIGEAAKIADVPTSVLRFWETRFPQIHPKRTESGQRLYRRQDVAVILQIKDLLYDRQFTIQGARKHLANPSAHPELDSANPVAATVNEIRRELIGIRCLLDSYGQTG